jgi:hypothetical protein
MTIPAHYPTEKVPDEIRECSSCHLKVIARGDQHGWKGVDAGGGVLKWFCDKSICQQQRDEFIAQRQQEMMREVILKQQPAQKPVEELTDSEANEEEERLRTRLMALKTRKRQTAAGEPVDQAAKESKVEPAPPNPFAGVTVHQTRDGVTSLCGAEGALFAVGEDLPDSCVPCVQCAEIFDAQVQAESPSPVAVDSSPQEPQEPAEPGKPGGGEVVRAEPAKPPQVDLDRMPRFTQDLIKAIVDSKGAEYDGGYILIPPSAYPSLNLEVTDPERLRLGVDGLLEGSGLVVGDIKRARRGEEFRGVVFNLVAQPKK